MQFYKKIFTESIDGIKTHILDSYTRLFLYVGEELLSIYSQDMIQHITCVLCKESSKGNFHIWYNNFIRTSEYKFTSRIIKI